MEMMKAEETRKGPWTEEEDIQLTCYVEMFGERRWDFIAKVSGLRRTGKSCRLRWVNYLHPGLKRGRMTPQEERMVVELHSRWGNRWSRIAQKLPGRTDNEIKNYWRTHMRKEAQERKRNGSYRSSGALLSSSSSSSSSSTSFVIFTQPEESLMEDIDGRFFPMEKIWDEIASSELDDPQPPQPPQSLPPMPPKEINTTTLHSPLCFCCYCLTSFPNEEDELKALICMGSSELLSNDPLDGRTPSPEIFQQSTFV